MTNFCHSDHLALFAGTQMLTPVYIMYTYQELDIGLRMLIIDLQHYSKCCNHQNSSTCGPRSVDQRVDPTRGYLEGQL